MERKQRKPAKTSDLAFMYTQQHLTLRQIAVLVGMSAAGVNKRLKKLGIKYQESAWVLVNCGTCGQQIRRTRSDWRKNIESYCNDECRNVYLSNPEYNQSRSGQRQARAIVSQFFDLQPGHVVHHEDSNDNNNEISNLKVFANNSDHLKYHHGKTVVVPIWDGAYRQRRQGSEA